MMIMTKEEFLLLHSKNDIIEITKKAAKDNAANERDFTCGAVFLAQFLQKKMDFGTPIDEIWEYCDDLAALATTKQ